MEMDYQIENGIITSPGKFEGEKPFVPYFFALWNEGAADVDNGDSAIFRITNEDKEIYPELADIEQVEIWTSESGFVYCQ